MSPGARFVKACIHALCVLASCGCMQAHAKVWQPSPGHTQIPVWPGTPTDALPTPGPEYALTGHKLIGGRPVTAAFDVSRPTMTVYAPSGKNTAAAVVVFPGGGFAGLAIDLEGTDACNRLTSIGITCVLLKYRVPSAPYDSHCKCRPSYPASDWSMAQWSNGRHLILVRRVVTRGDRTSKLPRVRASSPALGQQQV
jgi:hypothetical protein